VQIAAKKMIGYQSKSSFKQITFMPFNLSANDGDEFPIERQRMTNWCWAACTKAICSFYEEKQPFTQQQLVARLLNQPICKAVNPISSCNKKLDFGIALEKVGHLSGATVEDPLPSDQLFAALKGGRPVGCQLDIPQIGGHAIVVISGKLDPNGRLFLRVADPSDGSILTMSFSSLRNNFRSTGGRWVRSYFTKPLNGI
jgi:Papain-like cysteine protease AvrRpt2